MAGGSVKMVIRAAAIVGGQEPSVLEEEGARLNAIAVALARGLRGRCSMVCREGPMRLAAMPTGAAIRFLE